MNSPWTDFVLPFFKNGWWTKCELWPNLIAMSIVVELDCKNFKNSFCHGSWVAEHPFWKSCLFVWHCKFLKMFSFLRLASKKCFYCLSNCLSIYVHFVHDLYYSRNIENAIFMVTFRFLEMWTVSFFTWI